MKTILLILGFLAAVTVFLCLRLALRVYARRVVLERWSLLLTLFFAWSSVAKLPPFPTDPVPARKTGVPLNQGRAAAVFVVSGVTNEVAEFPVGRAVVTFAWQSPSETNLVGYILSFGVATTNYTTNLFVPGPVTSCVVSNLQEEQLYFFALRATNTAGLASAYSAELAYLVPLRPWTSVVTLSASITNWPAIAWTNAVLPTRFYTVRYSTNTATPVYAPTPLGSWTTFTNWPVAVTTNRQIRLNIKKVDY